MHTPRPQAGGNTAERMGHLVLVGFRKHRTNSHGTSELALLRILPLMQGFEPLHQLASRLSNFGD